MEPGAKGRRRLGHQRREVQEEPAEERTTGARRQGVPAELSAAAPWLAGECPEPPSLPTFTRPGAASDSEQPVERPERARRGRREGGRFLPGPWERGTEGGVVSVGSDRTRSREGLTSQPSPPLLSSVGWKSSVSSWKKTSLPGSAPFRPGPTHNAIAATATTATEEPVRHRRSATGPEPPASMRSRLSPKRAGQAGNT
ncbi:uncharacterized protein LOC144366162 [Ictidomys tridecemlineatus]